MTPDDAEFVAREYDRIAHKGADGEYIVMSLADHRRLVVLALLSQRPSRPAVATSACPICERDTPHPHILSAVEKWATNQVSRWGYTAKLFVHGGDNSLDPEIKRIVVGLRRAKDEWNKYPVGFRGDITYDTPTIDRALSAIGMLQAELDAKTERIDAINKRMNMVGLCETLKMEVQRETLASVVDTVMEIRERERATLDNAHYLDAIDRVLAALGAAKERL